MRISPKADFLKDKTRVGHHLDMMASPSFQEAAKAAMLSYQYTVNVGTQENPALVAVKLKGAQEYLDALMSLGEPEPTRGTVASEELTPPEEFWKAKQNRKT